MNPASLAATALARTLRVDGQGAVAMDRAVPEETPVAFVYDATTEAVMMATPADLEDFAVGFSLTERIVGSAQDIAALEIAAQAAGVELRMWLTKDRAGALASRRRTRAGPTGCGLCGIESLAEALPTLAVVRSTLKVRTGAILEVMKDLADRQTLNRQTRAMHGAAFFVPGRGIVIVREDVGRHNALDKLAGAMARGGERASEGVVLITSRVSVELVQKAAVIGAPILAAVSAPTALALRVAEAAGVTIVGVVRADGLEVFTGAERILTG
ncbi:MAG TPA: formate dehydrogenase accessory sulfurtransferase FdhD [Caulobacteraceae bacterium]|jgi:FdhD protein|nr:formate dehydrogenase accessory sulfurtransferase FdhD [Caulobacteraceae bacterium]